MQIFLSHAADSVVVGFGDYDASNREPDSWMRDRTNLLTPVRRSWRWRSKEFVQSHVAVVVVIIIFIINIIINIIIIIIIIILVSPSQSKGDMALCLRGSFVDRCDSCYEVDWASASVEEMLAVWLNRDCYRRERIGGHGGEDTIATTETVAGVQY